MSQLRILLFGPPRIEHNGAPIVVGRRKAVALLAYLAMSGRPQSRDSIAALLWPDYDQQQARAALRRDLAALNQALPGEWLQSNREFITLQPPAAGTDAQARHPRLWLDVSEFRQQAAVCQAHRHGPDEICAAYLPPLAEAANLYRADFLAGFTLRDSPDFDDWQLFQAESLRRELAGVLTRLVQGHCDQGRVEVAIEYARRWLALDPLQEAAHRRLMQLYAWADQQGAAVRQYEECMRVLAAELRAEPSAETSALYQAIVARQLPSSLRIESRTAAPTVPLFLQQEATTPETQPSTFVARERELTQLQRLLGLAMANQGRVAFVCGDAGSGKTALLHEFARRARAEHSGLIVATGSCQAFAGIGDPYLPFLEILGLLTGDVEARCAAGAISRAQAYSLWCLVPDAVQAILAGSIDLLDTFIPGVALLQRAQAAAPKGSDWVTELETRVGAQVPASAAVNEPAVQQKDLFAQTTRFLLALARRHPLLLVLDDLQWADAGSIHLLFHLGRQLPGSRIMLVGLYRPADVALGRPALMGDQAPERTAERHPLAPVLAELQRTFGDNTVDLGQADGRAFLQSLLASERYRLDANFETTLYQHTEGQALFTVEMLRAMQVRGDLVQDGQGAWVEGVTLEWGTLPARVEGVIGERIERLPAILQTVLKIAAVEGETFTAETIAGVQGAAAYDVIQQLSNVLDRLHQLVRLLDVQHLPSGRLSRYRFRHHLFQKYLYQRLDTAERASLHEAVGQVLVHLYGEETEKLAPQVARHFELAGLGAMATTYLRRAGDTAARLYATSEAADYYRRALTLTTPATPAAELSHLYLQLGRMLELDSRFDQALAVYAALEQVARERDDPGLELAALMATLPIFATPTSMQDTTLAQARGRQALSLARAMHDQVAEAKILWNLSIAVATLQMEQAIDYGEQSLALARSLNLAEQTALTLSDLGMFCYSQVGRIGEAVTVLYEAGAIWRELGNLPLLCNNLAYLGRLQIGTGEYERGLATSTEAFQIAQRIQNAWGQAFSTWTEGYVYWEQGDVDGACQAMEACIRRAEHAGFKQPQLELPATLAQIYGELGAYERAFAMAARVIAAVSVDEQDLFIRAMRVMAEKVLAQLYLHLHRPADAEGLLRRGRQDASREAMPAYFALREWDLVEAELSFQQEDYGRARSVTEHWLRDLHKFGLRSRLPYALLMQGKIHLALGERTQARACWQDARREAEELGSRWALWQILAALAELEEDADHAAELRRQAHAITDSIAGHIGDEELRVSFLNLPAVLYVQ